MSRRRAFVGVGLAALVVATGIEPVLAAPDRAAQAAPVVPPGTTLLLESGAWSWFEDERAMVDFAGNRLYVSAVAATSTTGVGEIVAGEVDVATGQRQTVSLGTANFDDHNSAAIWEARPSGEILTAWTGHIEDNEIRTHRRRTNGSWIRLPVVTDNSNVTYNNLYEVLSEDGTAVLYDFYRGTGADPEAMASTDGGRTWSLAGELLTDPADDPNNRPYVRYASRGDRIDLIATEEHPADTNRTSIYHGYIRDGIVHTSTGTALGRVGTGIPVTNLTRVWTATAAEEAWTVDVTYDPATGHPVAAFSSTLSVNDHRYYVARWDGTTWTPDQIAYAGRALYAAEPHYTGLVALDPADTNHLVISADVDPNTGTPLVSASDGLRHWELFDGHRQADGSYTWTPLTANSTSDNLRPIITRNSAGAWALAWLRGRYTTYTNYDLEVVGVIRRPDGSNVTTSATAPRRLVVAGITDPGPSSTAGVPMAGDYDSHNADDLFVYRPTSTVEHLVIGDNGRYPIHAAPPVIAGSYEPFAGDFDGDGLTDIFWYAPGTATDSISIARSNASFATAPQQQVGGTYTPIPGDYDADGDTDIVWYGTGSIADSMWLADSDGTFTVQAIGAVNGPYTPFPGDFDADGDTDIFWYAPGTTEDRMWLGGLGATFTSRAAPTVNGTYTPVPGDYDGDADTDIFWYAAGAGNDFLWQAQPGLTFTTQSGPTVNGTYRPAPADLDDNGRDDIYWYATGGTADHIWWAAEGTTPFTTAASNLNM